MTKVSALPTDGSPTSTDYVLTHDTETVTTKKTLISDLQPQYNPYKFLVYRNAAQVTGNSAFALIPFDTKIYDTSSNVDVVTNKGRFTAPIAGFYHFNASYSCTAGASDALIITLYKNGVEIDRGNRIVVNAGIASLVYGNTIQLAQGDYVEVYSYASGGARTMEVGASTPHPIFSGFLVSRT